MEEDPRVFWDILQGGGGDIDEAYNIDGTSKAIKGCTKISQSGLK